MPRLRRVLAPSVPASSRCARGTSRVRRRRAQFLQLSATLHLLSRAHRESLYGVCARILSLARSLLLARSLSLSLSLALALALSLALPPSLPPSFPPSLFLAPSLPPSPSGCATGQELNRVSDWCAGIMQRWSSASSLRPWTSLRSSTTWLPPSFPALPCAVISYVCMYVCMYVLRPNEPTHTIY